MATFTLSPVLPGPFVRDAAGHRHPGHDSRGFYDNASGCGQPREPLMRTSLRPG